ncbi:MAG: thioredoxin, partial [Pseudonocardiales bacterium]|nr:thioredoxin [Pseudonocardiales bacterium]
MTMVGLAVLVGTVLVATAVGLVLRARAGRVRAGRSTSAEWARWGV